MDMEKNFFCLFRKVIRLGLRALMLAWVTFSVFESSMAQGPKRINKAIELLSKGQPIYYVHVVDRSYEGGRKMAQTWADYITYDMEHNPLDIPRLARFMEGLIDGGPTKSGHRTPAVVVTLPIDGFDEAVVWANSWIIKQVLATGVHGLLLCHAQTPGAIQAFVEASRYPMHQQGVGEGLRVGQRGNGGQGPAAGVWGISVEKYLQKADVWPLNSDGEILLGVKIEDKVALSNTRSSLRVPGVGFAEWGPGDMSFSLGVWGLGKSNANLFRAPLPSEMQSARGRVLAACKENNLAFLNGATLENISEMIREGVMIVAGASESVANKGRQLTNRQMAW